MRQLIVVDVETTGLEERHVAIEVAAVNVQTGEELYFVPHVTSTALGAADREALQINRYYERGIWAQMDNLAITTWAHWDQLRVMLLGNTLGGSNPRFDAPKLMRGINHWADRTKHLPEPWHYRLADLSAYAAGALGLPLTELPGLYKVCELLGVKNEEVHSAMGDARATAECFRLLQSMTVGKI